MAPEIKTQLLHQDAVLPSFETPGSAGADVRAVLDDGLIGVMIQPGARALIQTGLAFEIPVGYEIQVRPRSGLAFKNGITVLNTPGTIDSDYRGELGVILINHGNESFIVKSGDRIAQIVVAVSLQGKFTCVNELGDTARGAGGFGSTGVA